MGPDENGMPLPCAGRAAKVARRGGPDRRGLALTSGSLGDRRAGKGRAMGGEQAPPGSRQGTREPRATTGLDVGIELLKQKVSWAAFPERWQAGWRLNRGGGGGTRCALNYRREGETIIVDHDGRGWWDPQSEAKYRRPIVGAPLPAPAWEALEGFVRCAAPLLRRIRTQSGTWR